VIAFRSHWGFKSEYCNPASGNEKGGVEGELGWFRRNWLVTVPEASDLESLNQKLLAACALGRERTIIGRNITVGQASRMEQPYLLPLAEERLPIDGILYPLVVDGKGCVKVKTNWYSTPLWPGLRVTARVWPSLIEIEHDGRCVARYQRSYGRGQPDSESRTLPRSSGEEAGNYARIDSADAVAASRTLAGADGSDLAQTGGAARQEPRH
jgi:hypothetical protein